MRVVHHHYSSGIDQRSGGERKRKRTRENEKIFIYFFGDKTTELNISNNTVTPCFDFSEYGFKQELFHWRVPVYGSLYAQPCGGTCCICSSCYVCSSSPLGVQFSRRMLLYPVWIYFPTLGGEGTFVRVGVKTEFIASWLPPRMRTARMMGHREDPPSQRGTFAAAREEEGAPHVAVTTVGCRTSKNWAKASLTVAKNNVYGSGLEGRRFTLLNCTSLLGNIRLNFTYWPRRTYCKVLPSLVTAANLDKQSMLAYSQVSKTIGSVAYIPQEVKDYFWSWTYLLTSRSCRYACIHVWRDVSRMLVQHVEM